MEDETLSAEGVAGAPPMALGMNVKAPRPRHIRGIVMYRVRAAHCFVLGVLIFNMVLFTGWYGYVYGPSSVCVVGPLCSMGTVSPALQGALFGLGLGLSILGAWLVSRAVLRQANAAAAGTAGERFAAFIEVLGDVHKLFGLVGGLVFVGLAVAVGTQRGSALTDAMSMLTVLACFWAAVTPPQPGPVHATDVRGDKTTQPKLVDDAQPLP